MIRREEDNPHLTGYCRGCGSYVTSETQDVGIGPYEFWGARGCQTILVEVCPKCEGEVEECGQPCHVCKHYEVEDDFKCEIDLAAGGFPGPEKLDRGDECKFFEPKEE